MAKRKATREDGNPSRKGKQLIVRRDSLPQDLVMEIIERLPLKSLARFRCVNRCLYSSITDPRFLTKQAIKETDHNQKIFGFSSKNFSLYKINIHENRKLMCRSFYIKAFEHPLFREGLPSIVSCNGLLCVVYNHTEFILLNPLTGEGRRLFRRKWLEGNCHFSYGLGYDPRNEDYKIVRIVDGRLKRSHTYAIDIFSVKNNRWKTLRLRPRYGRDTSAMSAIHVSGVLHWKASYPFYKGIVSFHLGDEKYGRLMVPCRESLDHSFPLEISVLQGCLCISQYRKTCYVVWQMKEYGVEDSWANIFTIKLFEIYDVDSSFGNGVRPLCCTRDGTLLVMINGRREIILYDSTDGSICNFSGNYSGCIPYVESLVSPYFPKSRRR